MSKTAKALAFPNAYVDVDEPPNNAFQVRILSLAGMVGIAYFGLTILALHLLPTGYDPAHQAVSDYAVGRFGVVMGLGFFVGGLGVVALAAAISISEDRQAFKVGSRLLLVAGVCLFIVGAFPTDIEGAAVTLHGTVHDLLSIIVFVLSPVAMLLVSYGKGKGWLWPTVAALAAGLLIAVVLALPLGASGLSERAYILVLVVWWFVASNRIFRTA